MPTPRRRKQGNGDKDAASVSSTSNEAPETRNAHGLFWLRIGAVALAFALYANAIALCGFCYDDLSAIVDNPDVLNAQGDGTMSSFGQVWRNDFWGTPIDHRLSHKSYRPMVTLSFRLDAMVTAEPWLFHLTNVALYGVCVWMVATHLLAPLCGEKVNLEAVFLATLWFTTHPVHTEAVTSLVGRAEVLAAICGVLGTRWASNGRILPAMAIFGVGCLCKETAVMIPAIVAGVDVAAEVFGPSHDKHSRIPRIVAMITTAGGYLALRTWITGGTQTVATSYVDNFLQHLGPMDKLRTALYIQAVYMQLLLCPTQLSCDYGFAVIKPVRAWLSPEMGAVTVVLSGIVVWAVYAVTTLRRTGRTLPLLTLAWTLGPLIPASHIVPIGTVLAERLLFVPSIGVAMLLAHVVTTVRPRLVWPLRFGVLVSALWFGAMTVRRNPDWVDIATLHTRDLATHPTSIKLLQAAADRNKEHNFDYAFECAEQAQRLVDREPPGPGEFAPPFDAGVSTMAFLKTKTDSWSKANATESLQYSLRVINEIGYNNSGGNAGWSNIHKVLGIGYLKLATPTQDQKLLKQAESALSTSILYDVQKKDSESHCRLGMVLGMLGHPSKGCFSMEQAVGAESQTSDIQNFAVLMIDLMGLQKQDLTGAKQWGEQAAAATQRVLDRLPIDASDRRTQWEHILAEINRLRKSAT